MRKFMALSVCCLLVLTTGCNRNREAFEFTRQSVSVSVACPKDWICFSSDENSSPLIVFCKDYDTFREGEWYVFLNFSEIDGQTSFDEFEKSFFPLPDSLGKNTVTSNGKYIRIYRLKNPGDIETVSMAVYFNPKA